MSNRQTSQSHMIKRIKQKTYIPFCIYLALLFIYYLLRWLDILNKDKWLNYAFDFLVLVAPFLVMLSSIVIYRKSTKMSKWNTVFLLGALPGFLPGAIFGFGLWGLGHGDTIFGFLSSVLITGLPTAFAFGILGLVTDYIYKKALSMR